jgi:hypothetical protein
MFSNILYKYGTHVQIVTYETDSPFHIGSLALVTKKVTSPFHIKSLLHGINMYVYTTNIYDINSWSQKLIEGRSYLVYERTASAFHTAKLEF